MTDDVPMVDYWMGELVAELTRKELISAISLLGREMMRMRESAIREREFVLDVLRPRRYWRA